MYSKKNKHLEQNLTDEQIIELSKQQPNKVFKTNSGLIAFQGKFYTKKEIDDLISFSNSYNNPVFRFIVKILTFFSKTFGRKKK